MRNCGDVRRQLVVQQALRFRASKIQSYIKPEVKSVIISHSGENWKLKGRKYGVVTVTYGQPWQPGIDLQEQVFIYKSAAGLVEVSSHKSLILGTTQLQFCRPKWILNAYIVTQTRLSRCFKSIYYSQGEETKFAFMNLHCRGRSLKHFAKCFMYRSFLWNFGLAYLKTRKIVYQ